MCVTARAHTHPNTHAHNMRIQYLHQHHHHRAHNCMYKRTVMCVSSFTYAHIKLLCCAVLSSQRHTRTHTHTRVHTYTHTSHSSHTAPCLTLGLVVYIIYKQTNTCIIYIINDITLCACAAQCQRDVSLCLPLFSVLHSF